MPFPATFDYASVESDRTRFLEKKMQEQKLLAALMITDDPQKLKELAGIRTTVEVYRTLDRLSMRREYQEALARHGLDLDFLTKKLKSLVDCAASETVQLGALQTLMKSLGVDKYEEEGAKAGSWEDELMKATLKAGVEPKALVATPGEGSTPEAPIYEVKIPEPPPEVKEAREKEREEMKQIFR